MKDAEAKLVRIPARFYDDHQSRDLDTPRCHKFTRTHVWIDPADPAVPELLDDARYYTDPYGPGAECPGLRASARATVATLAAAPQIHDA